MPASFRFPSPVSEATSTMLQPEPTSPRKRLALPGYDVSTVITANGYQAAELVHINNNKCKNHRQRYPEIEAIVQMFFRVCAVVLNIVVLIIVRILDINLDAIMAVKKLYGVVAYSLLLNCIEFISLCNPQPTLLIYLFPRMFLVQESTSSPNLRPRFPRLPSAWLVVCEFAALTSSFWSAMLFLNPVIQDDDKRGNCPKMTCVTPEEHDMIHGYILEVMVGLVHVGFFLMAGVHVVKRNGPGWLQSLEK